MIANITPPTGDPNILGYVLVAKDMMRAIEIKMDSGEIGHGDLGIERMAEFEEDTQGEDGNNLLDELQMNEEELQADLQEHNNQQLEAAAASPFSMQQSSSRLKQSGYVPQTPAVAPYQAYLASCNVSHPPFMASHSAGEMTTDDCYQQMMISRMERQELEEQE